ncbi:MAG: flavodoxin family protein [Deltaproteobacteria bacterium]|nr:flavodoxin family protein [Deltaproteobacteria bacterium]
MCEQVRILGIVGSPRRQGNSTRLLEVALRAAGINGALVQTLGLDELRLQACDGCEACSEGLACVKNPDDASRLLASLHLADVLIVACPVYFFGVPSRLKSLIDRSQPYWWRGEQNRRRGLPRPVRKPAYAIVTAGRNRAGGFDGVLGCLKAFCFSLDFELQTPLLLPSADEPSTMKEGGNAMLRAAEMGRMAAGGS